MRRHLKPAELDEAQATAGRVRRIELIDAEFRTMGVAGEVDQQIAEDAIDQPGAHPILRAASVFGGAQGIGNLPHGNFQLIQIVRAAFISARRAGWSAR